MWTIILCLWLWTISLLIFFKPPPSSLFVCLFIYLNYLHVYTEHTKKAQHDSQCFFESINHNKYFIIIFFLSFCYLFGRLEKSCLATTARIFSLHRTCWISTTAATTTMATNKSAAIAAACSTTTGTECMTINFYFYVVFCIFGIHMNVERFTAPPSLFKNAHTTRTCMSSLILAAHSLPPKSLIIFPFL